MNGKKNILLNLLDKTTLDNVILLERKLKGLRAEIEVQLDFSRVKDTQLQEKNKAALETIVSKMENVLNWIDKTLNMEIDDEEVVSSIKLNNNPIIKNFSNTVLEKLQIISALKEKF